MVEGARNIWPIEKCQRTPVFPKLRGNPRSMRIGARGVLRRSPNPSPTPSSFNRIGCPLANVFPASAKTTPLNRQKRGPRSSVLPTNSFAPPSGASKNV